MREELGVGMCGLVCAACSANTNCVGCHKGGCPSSKDCEVRNCCLDKGYSSCSECLKSPCDLAFYQNIRTRALIEFVKQTSNDDLVCAIRTGEKEGKIYNYNNHSGYYDTFETSEEIIKELYQLLKKGR